jgi:hypothetical protein
MVTLQSAIDCKNLYGSRQAIVTHGLRVKETKEDERKRQHHRRYDDPYLPGFM